MYSEQLEALIKSILADGKITEKERAVLHKKAEAEGVDVDEIDVYVDGLLTQMDNNGKIVKKSKGHDLSLFIKETSPGYFEPVYYKLKKKYLRENLKVQAHGVKDIQITFIDTIEFRRVGMYSNEKNEESWKKTNMGLGLLLCVNIPPQKYLSSLPLCFSTNDNELLVLHDDDYYSKSFKNQTIKDKIADAKIAYKIDEEQLKALCGAHNISIKFQYYDDDTDYVRLEKTPLPGFEYYCQYFYNLIVDNTAYKLVAEKQDAKEKEAKEKEIVELEVKKRIDEKSQKYAGLLSGQFKLFKKITPIPPYITQLLSERDNVTITHVKGKIYFKETKDEGKEQKAQTVGYISMHSLTLKGEKPLFFLGVTVTNANGKLSLENKYFMRVTLNMEDNNLHSVTTEKRFLNKKSKYSGKSFNFFACSDEGMQQILQTRDNFILFFDGQERTYITKKGKLGFLKKSPIPTAWKNAYAAITDETVIENWIKQREANIAKMNGYKDKIFEFFKGVIGKK